MQVSAEIRWFWRDAPPSGFEDWFRGERDHSCPVGGGRDEPRCDVYLNDASQSELGVKRRGGKDGVEVKGLVRVVSTPLAAKPFVGEIELWTKWTTEKLDLASNSTIAIDKWRWLRKFDTSGRSPREIPLDQDENPIGMPLPARGCNVELTKVRTPSGGMWWTFGFEAFGPFAKLDKYLRSAAKTLARRKARPLEAAQLASYPLWLKENVATRM